MSSFIKEKHDTGNWAAELEGHGRCYNCPCLCGRGSTVPLICSWPEIFLRLLDPLVVLLSMRSSPFASSWLLILYPRNKDEGLGGGGGERGRGGQ